MVAVSGNCSLFQAISRSRINWVSVPGEVLGQKPGGGVPRAAENWTLKDRGKNGIWGQKDVIQEGLVPSPDLNLTPLAAFFNVFCRAQRGSDRNLPLFVRWVRHKNVSHPNHSMSATILSTCYALTESLGVSELNDANIKSFGVPGRISRAVESTNLTTIVFTLLHIMAPKFANQLPIRNIGRTCNGSGNV